MANAGKGVDVHEPANPPSRAVRPALAAPRRLSPVQEAYEAWARHQVDCGVCRNVDAGPCQAMGLLRRRWDALAGAAVRRVADESA
ncbi:hypothetical protein AB0Q95_21325 [Streptomyces sp. NPDC059900]|uniref:hypothetical protein n=1 Tax=Streptomyces sp. NPDC059900 TaxID=3155816 RepID=UPI003443A9C7